MAVLRYWNVETKTRGESHDWVALDPRFGWGEVTWLDPLQDAFGRGSFGELLEFHLFWSVWSPKVRFLGPEMAFGKCFRS